MANAWFFFQHVNTCAICCMLLILHLIFFFFHFHFVQWQIVYTICFLISFNIDHKYSFHTRCWSMSSNHGIRSLNSVKFGKTVSFGIITVRLGYRMLGGIIDLLWGNQWTCKKLMDRLFLLCWIHQLWTTNLIRKYERSTLCWNVQKPTQFLTVYITLIIVVGNFWVRNIET